MTWTPSGFLGTDNIISVAINGGTLVLAAPHPRLVNRPIVNNGTFRFDAPTQSQTFGGPFSGSGPLEINAGTLTLSGSNTYAGATILNGGTVIVSSVENAGVFGPLGKANLITFAGGTLQFSVSNTFDYSPRFDMSPGQLVRINTGGQNVTFTNGLTSVGGTLSKLGSGTLTLAGANSYNGLTTVSAGKLVIQGSAGSGDIIVADDATLGAVAGTPLSPGTLTLQDGATLEFNGVNNTSSPLITAGTLSSGATIIVNINSGIVAAGQSYPLLSWTNGSAPAVDLRILIGATGSLSTNGNSIHLDVADSAFIWTDLNNGNWDTITPNNWIRNANPAVFVNGHPVLFDDTASGTTNVTVTGIPIPSGILVNNNTRIYSITSSGAAHIAGSGGLTKNGSATLTMSGGANTYTGPTILLGGTMIAASLINGGAASDIGASSSDAANLVLNGGTLRYTGSGASSDRMFTLGTAGGTIDSSGPGALNLNNTGAVALAATGTRTLTLTGANSQANTLAAALGDNSGATAILKSGTGRWILAGNNTNSGQTTIASGVLQVGAGGASGALGSGNVINNGGLVFNVSGTSIVSGNISGVGPVTNIGAGTVVLNGSNTYSGGTYIQSGTLQFGTGTASGSVFGNAPILVNGTVIFNSTTLIRLSGFGSDLSGTGNVIVRAGTAQVRDGSGVGYTGWTQIDPGATYAPCMGQTTGFVSSGITNNGTLMLFSQNFPPTFGVTNSIVGSGKVWVDLRNSNSGQVAFGGTNAYAGGTFIGGGGLVIGDGITPQGGAILGDVVFTNTVGPHTQTFNTSKRILFNQPAAFTFTNNIISAVSDGSEAANSGSLEQLGPGTVTLTGNNSYPGDTTVTAGTILQVGNGGASGSIGSGPVFNSGTLVFNRSDSYTVPGVISGAGSIIKLGVGTLTLAAANTCFGPTTVSNGTLVVSGGSIAGNLFLEGGAIAAGPAGTVATLNVASDMNIHAGTVQVTLNKGLPQSNTLYSVTDSLSAVSGSVDVTNAGPALQSGDTFVLFNQPVINGHLLTITGPAGITWTNKLAVNGSITVLPPPPATLSFTRIGDDLHFSWTNAGAKLQAQTNSLSDGLQPNWADVPGGGSSPVIVPIGATNDAVFFRLAP